MEKKQKKLFTTGIIGSFLCLLGCATPYLALAFGTIGLGALSGYLDYVLIPATVLFIGLAFYSLENKKNGNNQCCSSNQNKCCS